jgi:hypothetical protein
MLVSHCPVRGQCSECEEVVTKKGERKPGDEKKTINRCNRYTLIDKDLIYDESDDNLDL